MFNVEMKTENQNKLNRNKLSTLLQFTYWVVITYVCINKETLIFLQHLYYIEIENIGSQKY